MDYFGNCHTVEEARNCFRDQAKKLHPDCGGTHTGWLELERQYEACLLRIKSGRAVSLPDPPVARARGHIRASSIYCSSVTILPLSRRYRTESITHTAYFPVSSAPITRSNDVVERISIRATRSRLLRIRSPTIAVSSSAAIHNLRPGHSETKRRQNVLFPRPCFPHTNIRLWSDKRPTKYRFPGAN